ncbi:MAG: hypothetical protein HY319_29860 [Armatimonadetes bacterium]|nr:hypothetical protein [Armatimonadota bacterium]
MDASAVSQRNRVPIHQVHDRYLKEYGSYKEFDNKAEDFNPELDKVELHTRDGKVHRAVLHDLPRGYSMRVRVSGPEGVEKREYFLVEYGFDGHKASSIKQLQGNAVVGSEGHPDGAIVTTSTPLARAQAGDAPPDAGNGDGPQFAVVMGMTEADVAPTIRAFEQTFADEWRVAEPPIPVIGRDMSPLLHSIAR